MLELSENEWDGMFHTSVRSIYLACKYAILQMIKVGGGSIINVGSVQGLAGYRGSANYGAAKAAVINLSRQMAVEFGYHGIRVNSVLPGRIITERKKKYIEDNPFVVRKQKSFYPLGRAGTPKELAYAALFLASDESSFVTGHALVVDGGLTAQIADTTAIPLEEGIREELAAQGINWPRYEEKGNLFKKSDNGKPML